MTCYECWGRRLHYVCLMTLHGCCCEGCSVRPFSCGWCRVERLPSLDGGAARHHAVPVVVSNYLVDAAPVVWNYSRQHPANRSTRADVVNQQLYCFAAEII